MNKVFLKQRLVSLAFAKIAPKSPFRRGLKDQPVERALIDKILDAAGTAPMGFPPHSTEVAVIDSRAERDHLVSELVAGYDGMIEAFANPIGRAMVRLGAGADNYRILNEHIIDTVRHANMAYRRDGRDRYLYGAPVVMLFHGDRRAVSYEENAHLICNYAMLAALSLDLGSTIIGLVAPIVDRSKALRERYGVPKGNRVLTCLVLGHPRYKYHFGIRRPLAGVSYH